MNDLYLRFHYLGIFHNGYGGLDNNGAGLMLAMGVPICILLWDQIRGRWRWFFLALAPVIIHAVLMTYSRGAMLSLLVTSPLLAIPLPATIADGGARCGFFFGVIPVMAGKEIRDRFLTLEHHEEDDSANSRRGSWAAAWKMAKDNPIFGVGVRNANLFSYDYGADIPGRTIHSQYLQIAADNGFVGLGLYLAMFASVWFDTRFCRRAVKGRDDLQSRRIYLVATAVETSMAVFCFGGAFLSLETFEFPFLLVLLGSQLAAIVKGQLDAERAGSRLGRGQPMVWGRDKSPHEGLLMTGTSFACPRSRYVLSPPFRSPRSSG